MTAFFSCFFYFILRNKKLLCLTRSRPLWKMEHQQNSNSVCQTLTLFPSNPATGGDRCSQCNSLCKHSGTCLRYKQLLWWTTKVFKLCANYASQSHLKVNFRYCCKGKRGWMPQEKHTTMDTAGRRTCDGTSMGPDCRHDLQQQIICHFMIINIINNYSLCISSARRYSLSKLKAANGC